MLWTLITISFLIQGIKMIMYRDLIDKKWVYILDLFLFIFILIYHILFFSYLIKWLVYFVKIIL
jgi:hypothetical protein